MMSWFIVEALCLGWSLRLLGCRNQIVLRHRHIVIRTSLAGPIVRFTVETRTRYNFSALGT